MRNKTPFDGKQGESNVKLFEDMQRSLTMDLTAKSVYFGPLLDLTLTVPLVTPENELPWLKQYNEKLFAVLYKILKGDAFDYCNDLFSTQDGRKVLLTLQYYYSWYTI